MSHPQTRQELAAKLAAAASGEPPTSSISIPAEDCATIAAHLMGMETAAAVEATGEMVSRFVYLAEAGQFAYLLEELQSTAEFIEFLTKNALPFDPEAVKA